MKGVNDVEKRLKIQASEDDGLQQIYESVPHLNSRGSFVRSTSSPQADYIPPQVTWLSTASFH